MLNINVPSSGQAHLTFSDMERYDLPKPPGGFDAEVNNTVLLKFDDEQQALDYTDELQEFASNLPAGDSAERRIINDLILAINQDPFVQSYLQ